ncbi:hypothetical protein, partial [Rhizobium leguminosarum]|uniref:hypothetical protein n=1 Tax=Rhizobium leguminosarum TaxID=384 RepID=UPI003F9BC9CF
MPPALPAALDWLNMFEVTTGGGNDDLVVQFNGQQATVTDHFEHVEPVEGGRQRRWHGSSDRDAVAAAGFVDDI